MMMALMCVHLVYDGMCVHLVCVHLVYDGINVCTSSV